jgi:VanZ family protein
MLKKFLRVSALSCAVILFVLTVVPAEERPVTGLGHDFEHFGAYLLAGFLFGYAFSTRLWLLLFGSVAFTLMIELVQIPLPTRHARLEDFLVDCSGMCLGVLIGIQIMRFVRNRLQAS